MSTLDWLIKNSPLHRVKFYPEKEIGSTTSFCGGEVTKDVIVGHYYLELIERCGRDGKMRSVFGLCTVPGSISSYPSMHFFTTDQLQQFDRVIKKIIKENEFEYAKVETFEFAQRNDHGDIR